jgi:uncharacterized protein (PEP-CTERM system associated)
MGFHSGPSQAQETYTDNVRLAPAGQEQGSFVTELRPALSVQGSGPRLRLNAIYSGDILLRSQEDSLQVLHNFNGSANAELMQQLLFLDARAFYSQQNISLLGPQPDSNINTTGNRTNIKSFLVSPYLRHNFGTDAQAEARYTYSVVNTDSEISLANSNSNRIDLRLTSGPAFKLYSWSLSYSGETIDYDQFQQQQINSKIFTASGRRLLTPTFAITSSVGYEKSDYVTLGEPPEGAFWNTGVDWTPSDRTRLTAYTGRRYYGNNSFLDFHHRTRLTAWSLGYSEAISTTRSQAVLPSSVGTAGYLDALFLTQFPIPCSVSRRYKALSFRTGCQRISPCHLISSQIRSS